MASDCYQCGKENSKLVGTVSKLIFSSLTKHITKEEHLKINGNDVIDQYGYYTATFDYAGDEEVYECDECLEKMIDRAKKNSIIFGVCTIILIGVGVLNLINPYFDKVFSFFLIVFGLFSGVLTIADIKKSSLKNINSSALNDFIYEKNNGDDYASYCDFGIGKEKQKFKPGDVLYIGKDFLAVFDPGQDLDGNKTYSTEIPFSPSDYFNYDEWKRYNNIL